jgi:hypothetical protein
MYIAMSEYTFPFNTCEPPNKKGIAQPYSVFFNLVSCGIIIYFLSITENLSSRLLLFSILLFEMFHTFSHSIHLPNHSQIIITHVLAYLVNFCYLYALYRYSNVFPSNAFLVYLLIVVLFDIYAFLNLPFVFYLSSQFLLFISLFLYYYDYFTENVKTKIPIIFILTFLIVLLFINESYNCEKMLEKCSWFPFHIFIEITAIFIVYNISSIFSEL